jgi:flagellar biosynthetic protein FliQ
MNVDAAVALLRGTFETAFWISLPILMIAVAAGALVSLFQILTSIQDSAVGTVPRLAAFLAGLLLLLPWMLGRLMQYTTVLFGDFGRYAR